MELKDYAPLLEPCDYVINDGQRYKVIKNQFDGNVLLKEVDKIPESYFNKWNDED